MRNKKSIIFMGTPHFAVPSLEKIHKQYHVLSVYTQPPKKSGRGLRTKLNPIHEISNDYNLPVKTPQNFKSFDIIEEIKSAADFALKSKFPSSEELYTDVYI